MSIREAIIQDIPQIQVVRNSVKENILSDPSVVTNADCVEFLTQRGKGWVYEVDNKIVGFAIVDLKDNNIWALFLHPDFEKKGIGRKLHDVMLNWYFAQDKSEVWLGTTPQTRAENFYRAAGWLQNGMNGDEVRFEMTKELWEKNINKG